MFYMIGGMVNVNGVSMFKVLEVTTSGAASLEAMAAYSDMYTGLARRRATAEEYAAYSNGFDVEFGV